MKIYVFVLASLLTGCATTNLEAPFADPNKSREFATIQALNDSRDLTQMKLLMLDGKPPVFKKDLFTAAEGFWSEKMHALPGVHVIRAVCLIGELPSRSRAVADLEVTLVAGETYTFDCTPPDKYDSIKMYMTDSAGNDIRYRFIRSIPPNGQ